jgi:hypothetical protein
MVIERAVAVSLTSQIQFSAEFDGRIENAKSRSHAGFVQIAMKIAHRDRQVALIRNARALILGRCDAPAGPEQRVPSRPSD